MSNKYADAVAADNQRELEQHRNAWLQRGIRFDPGLRLPSASHAAAKRLFRDLVGRDVTQVRKGRFDDFEVLLANLMQSSTRPVVVRLDRNAWTASRYNKATYYVVRLIHMLFKRRLIGKKIGYITEKESRYTRIWRTQALLEACPVLEYGVTREPPELVILRDEHGKLKDYYDTAETYRIRKILADANKVNEAADVRYPEYRLHPLLHAVFRRKFTLCGRLYSFGCRHNYQGMKPHRRRRVTINGDPVVELDYEGLHPRLLYAAEGIQYDGDPYTAVHSDARARKFLKQILLIMLNAQRPDTAEWEANEWLRKKKKKNRAVRAALREIGITRAKPLMELMTKVHEPIAKYFCCGKETGLKLMNKDSKIALRIVKHFADAKIPILVVHDSFLVQRRHMIRLRKIMEEAYTKETGGFTCGITTSTKKKYEEMRRNTTQH